MRIWILSDLHRDVGRPWSPPSIPQADLAIVAGDVCESLVDSVHWVAEAIGAHMPTVMVAGNHEYYGHTLPGELARGREAASRSGVHLLENDTVLVGGVAVSGCTLWTDYALHGVASRPLAMTQARVGLNDHRHIAWATKPEWKRFRPEEALELHRASRRYLSDIPLPPGAGPGTPRVVVTHHAPSSHSVAERYLGDPLNPAFVSDLRDVMLASAPALWVHGHTHSSFDYALGPTRVVCNPKGYGAENPDFDPALVVEVAA